MKELYCCECNQPYQVTKQKYSCEISNVKRNGSRHFCSKECRLKSRGHQGTQQAVCFCCKTTFTRHISAIKNSDKCYCSRSCAAKINNTLHPKRGTTSTKKCRTPECNELLTQSKLNVFCKSCVVNKKHIRGTLLDESTIQDVIVRAKSNRYDVIRAHCSAKHKTEKLNSVCEFCSYPHHLELCHIIPISSFPKDTKLKVVNAPTNILFLCSNCHWEYDNHFIVIDFDNKDSRYFS